MAPSLLNEAPQLDAVDLPAYVVKSTAARSKRYRTETISQRIAAAWRRRGASISQVVPSALPPSALDAVSVLRYEATVRGGWVSELKASKAPQFAGMVIAAGLVGWFIGHGQVGAPAPATSVGAALPPDAKVAAPASAAEPQTVQKAEPQSVQKTKPETVATNTATVKPAVPPTPLVLAPKAPKMPLVLTQRSADGKRVANLTYTVVRGDSFSSVSKRFNLRPRTVRLVNELPLGYRLRPGQKLVITPYDGAYHRVAAGETFSHLLVRYGVDRATVLQRNPGLASAHLHVGQKIFIPGATQVRSTPQAEGLRGYRSGPYAKRLDASRSLIGQFGNRVGQLSMPAHGDFSSPFGLRGHAFHPGMDISGAVGRPITAAKSGVVAAAGWAGAYGYAVDIDHGGGVMTRYGHCSRVLVSAGQQVAAGQLIAKMGSTGRSTGPHLHFEVRIQGRAVNPAGFL